MSLGDDAERMAATINALATGMARARALMTDRALAVLLADQTGLSTNTITTVMKAIENLPQQALTAQGRAIRIRED